MIGRSLARIALLGALALAAPACSSDGASSATDPTTTAATSELGDPTGPGPSDAELAAILPTAADLGEGWEELPGQDGGGSDDPVAIAQCPSLAVLLGTDDDPEADDRSVVRRFVDADGRLIGFELDPDAPAQPDDELEAAVDATNACGPIQADEVPVGSGEEADTATRFQAAIDPDHGEQAVKLQAEVSVTLEGEEAPAVTTLYVLVFRTGPVGVTITALDGLDLEELVVSRTDVELLTAWSDRVEAGVDDLVR